MEKTGEKSLLGKAGLICVSFAVSVSKLFFLGGENILPLAIERKGAKTYLPSLTQLWLTLCDPMDYTVYGILQARILEWVDFPTSRGSSQPRFPTLQADYLPAKPQGKPHRKTGCHKWFNFANWMIPSRILKIKGDEETVRIIYNTDPGRRASSNINYFYQVLSNSHESISVHLLLERISAFRRAKFHDSSTWII